MICSCPKCSAETELDVNEIPAEGSFNKCAACGANFVVNKESFAKRALYKSSDITCAECGNPPGSSIYCQNCHAIYPDFLVIETSSAAKKQFSKIIASFNIFKNLKINIPGTSSHGTAVSGPSSAPAKGTMLPGQPAQLTAILGIILLLVCGGGFYWYQDKTTTKYSQNYVKTLLVIKTARDFELGISNRVITGWKAGTSSSLTGAEVKSMASAKKDVDTLMSSLGKAPKKFVASSDAVNKLYASYLNLHTSITTTTGNADSYAATIKKADDDFIKSSRELKAGLPEKISDTLEMSKAKYKALQNF